jgi:tyrosyl-tRNA synthetase
MWRYMELLSFVSMSEIEGWRRACAEGANPRDYKARFAREIVAQFNGPAAAEKALENFEARFRQGLIPDDLEEREVRAGEGGCPVSGLLKDLGLTASTSESNRLIQQGGVRIDGEKVSDPKLALKAGETHVIQVGKRKFAKVRLVS